MAIETRYPRMSGHPIRRAIGAAPSRLPLVRDENDLKLFALSFTAFFICFYTFIA